MKSLQIVVATGRPARSGGATAHPERPHVEKVSERAADYATTWPAHNWPAGRPAGWLAGRRVRERERESSRPGDDLRPTSSAQLRWARRLGSLPSGSCTRPTLILSNWPRARSAHHGARGLRNPTKLPTGAQLERALVKQLRAGHAIAPTATRRALHRPARNARRRRRRHKSRARGRRPSMGANWMPSNWRNVGAARTRRRKGDTTRSEGAR